MGRYSPDEACPISWTTTLARLGEMGKPVNMLEIGFSATPQVIRNLAARGLIRVSVEITPRGREKLAGERAKKRRKETNAAKDERQAQRMFG